MSIKWTDAWPARPDKTLMRNTHTHYGKHTHTHVGWHILVNWQLEVIAPDVSLAASLSNAFERLNIFSQRLLGARTTASAVRAPSCGIVYVSLCFWPWPLAAAGVDRLPFDLHTPSPPPPSAIVGVNSKVLAAVAVLSLIEFAYGLLCSIRLTASHSLTLSSSPLSHDKFVVVL